MVRHPQTHLGKLPSADQLTCTRLCGGNWAAQGKPSSWCGKHQGVQNQAYCMGAQGLGWKAVRRTF